MNNTPDNWAVRYFTLWIGQALSLLGSQLVQFAIIWYLTETTNSATTLAIASMMGLLPQVLLSPFIGTWVDRGNRRLIIITADTTVALATIGLDTGHMLPENAAALVGAGVLSVIVFPGVALAINRTAPASGRADDAPPQEAEPSP